MFLIRLSLTLYFSFLVIAVNAVAESVATYAVLLPLTGNGSEQGQWCKSGLEIAADQLNFKDKNIELVFEDTHGDSKTALNAFRNITARKKLSGVSTWGSGVAMALSAITNKAQIIQMGIATATPAYSSVGDYSFRVFPCASDNLFVSSSEPDASHVFFKLYNQKYGEGPMKLVTHIFHLSFIKFKIRNSLLYSDIKNPRADRVFGLIKGSFGKTTVSE